MLQAKLKFLQESICSAYYLIEKCFVPDGVQNGEYFYKISPVIQTSTKNARCSYLRWYEEDLKLDPLDLVFHVLAAFLKFSGMLRSIDQSFSVLTFSIHIIHITFHWEFFKVPTQVLGILRSVSTNYATDHFLLAKAALYPHMVERQFFVSQNLKTQAYLTWYEIY